MAVKEEALLLLGGDMGVPEKTLALAVQAITELGEVLATSRDHWTEPWGFEGDRLFLNKAVLLSTALAPLVFMEACLAIEERLGRVRVPSTGPGPRIIDIDLLLMGKHTVDVPGLQLPHPRMHLRIFALGPATDVAPSWQHPLLGRTVLELLNDLRQRP